MPVVSVEDEAIGGWGCSGVLGEFEKVLRVLRSFGPIVFESDVRAILTSPLGHSLSTPHPRHWGTVPRPPVGTVLENIC